MNSDYHKLKILQVVPSLISGGVERGTIDISQALRSNNFESIVASNGGPLVKQITDHGGIHIQIDLKSKNPINIFNNIVKLQNIIKEYKIDLLHARSRAPAWSAYYAARRSDIPFVTTFHGTYNFNNFLKKYYNSIMLKGKKIIAVSNFIKSHILENYAIEEEKIEVIPRGADLNYFNPDKIENLEIFKHKYNIKPGNVKSSPVILMPGRISYWKGQDYLIHALSLIKEDFTCLIVGSVTKNKYFLNLKKLVNDLNLSNKVHFFPAETDMNKLYALADIVVSASREPEAFGRISIEAQSMKKLFIGTNIGGSVETVIDGKTGFLVELDNTGAFADKIRYCLNILNSKEYSLIGEAARKHIDSNFSLENMQNKTIKLYKDILKL